MIVKYHLYIAEYLHSMVPFFKKVKRELIVSIAKNIRCVQIQKHSLIISSKVQNLKNMPENSSKLFILFSGQVSQIMSATILTPIMVNSVFGLPLCPKESRYDYQVMTNTDWKLLVIEKADYDNVISDYLILQRIKNADFLNNLEILTNWDDMKKHNFHDKISSKVYSHDEVIFSQGDPPDAFYIIIEGLVKLSTVVNVSTINWYPIDQFKWEVKKTIRNIQYSLAILKPKSFFGHHHLDQIASQDYTARSLGKTEVFWVPRNVYLKFFGRSDRKRLFDIHEKLDLNQLLDTIIVSQKYQKQMSEAVLNATNLNYTPNNGRFELQNSKLISKIEPWMLKAKMKETSNKVVHEQNKKIKVLYTEHEKFTVDDFRQFHKLETDYPSIMRV